MLHAPQGKFVAFERKVGQNIIIRKLSNDYKLSGELGTRKMMANLWFLGQLLKHSPRLFACPAQRLCIFDVLPERILLELGDAAGDDIFDGIFDTDILTTADLMD
jgi:hypothetical protein